MSALKDAYKKQAENVYVCVIYVWFYMRPYVPNLTTTDGVGKILCFQTWSRWVTGKILSNNIPTHPWNIPQIPLESKDENDFLHKQVVFESPSYCLDQHIIILHLWAQIFAIFWNRFPLRKKHIKNTYGKRRLEIGSEGPFPSFAKIVGE